jgi:hypothetical protein
MSQQISQAQTRIDVDDGSPIVIDVEGALDEMYRSLVNERRRIVLCVLTRTSESITVDELTEAVTRQERPDDAEQPQTELKQRVRISLYHNHLPTLADRGLIKFDPDEMLVEDVADTVSLVSP